MNKIESVAYRRWAAVLLLSWTVVVGWNLSRQAISNPDEPRYACPARTMIRGGDAGGPGGLVVPYFNGRERLKKPILFYWCLAAAGKIGKLFGAALSTSFRWVSVLAGLAALAATMALGRRLFSPRVGLLAGGIFACTWYVHKMTRQLTVDMLLAAWLLSAWYGFVVAVERLEKQAAAAPPSSEEATGETNRTAASRRAWPALLLLYVAAGAACLTKGPFLVAAFLVLPAFAYLAWTRRLAVLKKAGLWWGVPLSLFLGFFWYLLFNGGLSVMWEQNVARAAGKIDHLHPVPFAFYLADLPQRFIPWILFLPGVLWWSLKRGRVSGGTAPENTESVGEKRAGFDPRAKFLLCALGIPFLFLGLALSKRGLYLLPLYPFLSLWTAWVWEEVVCERRGGRPACTRLTCWWRTAGAVTAVTATVTAAVLAWPRLPKCAPATPAETVIAGACVVGAACGVWLLFRMEKGPPSGRPAAALFAVLGLLLFSFEATLRPRLERRAGRAAFYTKVAEAAGKRPLILLGFSSNEAVWYLDRPVDDVRRPALRKRFFAVPSALLLVHEKVLDDSRRPELKAAVRVLRCFDYAGEKIYLAEADPAHPPTEKVFARKKKKRR